MGSNHHFIFFFFLGFTCPNRGKLLTPKDFEWPLPQGCFGKCVSGKSAHAKLVDHNPRFPSLAKDYHECYPVSDEVEHPCDLPCFKYGTSTNECVIRGGYTNPDTVFDRDNNCYDCDECTPAKWETCMKIKTPAVKFLNLYQK